MYSVKHALHYHSLLSRLHTIFKIYRRWPTLFISWYYFGICIFFCNYIFEIFDLYTVLYQITTETKCYTVSIECQQSKTLRFNFSWMLHHFRNTFGHLLIISAAVKVGIHLKVHDLFLDLKPKSFVIECILVGFEIHHPEMYNNIQYTNKATEPCLPLKFLGVSKEIISYGSFFL